MICKMEIISKIRGATIGKIYDANNECLGMFVGSIAEIKRDLEKYHPGYELKKLKIYPAKGTWY